MLVSVVRGAVFRRTPVIFIDVAWWVCSRILSLSFALVEALSDGLLHEAFVMKPLVLTRHRDSSLELCPLVLRFGANTARQAKGPYCPSCRVCYSLIVQLVALQNETPIPPQRLTVFISQLASSDIPRHGKAQPAGSSILSQHVDDDDDELLEEHEPWTGWTTSSPNGSACSAASLLGSMISSEECWSASLSASAMGWGAGAGKFSTSNAGKLSSAPTSRGMFLYTAVSCFGATILLRSKAQKNLLFRQT